MIHVYNMYTYIHIYSGFVTRLLSIDEISAVLSPVTKIHTQ